MNTQTKGIVLITPRHCTYDQKQYCKSFLSRKVFIEVGSSTTNTDADRIIITNLGNIKTLSGAKLIKLSIIFTGKLIISLPSYINLKSFINGNTGPVEKVFPHAIL